MSPSIRTLKSRGFCLLLGLLFLPLAAADAQTPVPAESLQSLPVSFIVKGLGTMDIVAVSREGKVFLPLTAIFKALHLKYDYSPQQGLVEGFISDPDHRYSINITTGRVQAHDSSMTIASGDFILAREEFYLRTDLYNPFFRLNMDYNPRRLAVTLRTNLRLPIFLERQRELARKRAAATALPAEVDTTVQRPVLFLGAGRLDWVLSSSVAAHGLPIHQYDLHLGNPFLGGDLETRVRGQIRKQFSLDDDAFIRQRYAFLDKSWIRQIFLGDVVETGITPLDLFGWEITNRPAPRRLILGVDELSDLVGSKQTTDLYVRGRLTESSVTGADGGYRFEAPLPYGISDYEVRSYDEFGVERVLRYRINVLPTLIPPTEVQYSFTGGRMRQRDKAWGGNFDLRWGVSTRLTVGTGVDYTNSNANTYSDKFFPSLSFAGRLSDLVTGEAAVAPTAFSRATITVTHPSTAGGFLSYQRFSRNPFYNPINMIDEKLASANIPLVYTSSRINLDFFLRQREFQELHEWSARGSVTAGFGPFTFRVVESVTWDDSSASGARQVIQHITNPSFNTILPANVILRTTAFWDHLEHQVTDFRIAALKNITRNAFIELFYERNFTSHLAVGGLQFSYYFPWSYLRGTLSKEGSEGDVRYTQSIGGSIGLANQTGDLFFDHLSNRVGLGGIIVHPFLDANNNGVQDAGEEFVPKARMHALVETGAASRLVYYPGVGYGLRQSLPYENYVITIDPESFDNPIWIPKFTSMSVISEPDQFQVIPLPVLVGGVVRGTVMEMVNGAQQPVEGITVKIESEDLRGRKPAYLKTLNTVSTGEFEFIGVPPGRYKVSVSEEMASRLGKVPDQSQKPVEVVSTPDGSEISGINFLLK